MRHKLTFVTGFAAGYVLGARAGRARYDAIMRMVRDLRDNPAVQETAGVLGAQASTVIGTAKRAVAEKVTSKVGGRDVTDEVSPYPPAGLA